MTEPHAPPATTYAGVMVPVDLGAFAAERVKLAAAVADRFGCRLIGVAAEDVVLPVYGEGVVALDDAMYEAEKQRVAGDLAEAQAVFRAALGGGEGAGWRQAFGTPQAFVVEQARAADLVVVSRRGPSDDSQGWLAVDPGDLVMSLGRPLLVVPPGVARLAAERVIVGWKDSRESRRALRDALPFLVRAREVIVASIGRAGSEPVIADVGAYLASYGVAVRHESRPEPAGTVAAELLKLAETTGADLIVSGAYGHSRAREWLLGGVTRELLASAPVCCLMSH